MTIPFLRDRIPGFVAGVEEELYRAETDPGTWPALGSRYQAAGDLFALSRITDIQRALAGSAGDEERRIRSLLEFAGIHHARSTAAAAMQERLEWEATGAHGSLEGTGSPVTMAQGIMEEGDAERRNRLEQLYLEALDDHRYLAEEVIARHRDALTGLGYGAVVPTLEILSGIDLRAIVREGESFLASTQSLYDDLLGWHLPRLVSTPLPEATGADLARLERGPLLDADFPGGDSYDAFLAAITGVGLDPTAEGRLRMERLRPARWRRSVCRAPRVPDDVRIAFNPAPGRFHWQEFLEALGAGLHWAFTDADLSVEERLLGDAAVPEASGVLFSQLLGTTAFAGRVLRQPRARVREMERLEGFLRLLRIRRDIARLSYSVACYSEDADAAVFCDLMQRATGVRYDPRAALWAVEPELTAARRIRAQQLGALHAEVLRNRFDEDWFRNPASGGYLRDLFSNGRRFTAQELAVQLGSPGLGYEAWMDSVRTLVRDS